MIGRPGPDETVPYYFKYIDRIQTEDVVGKLESQLDESLAFFRGVSEEKSLERYGPDKWSVRQVLNHVNDCERLFVFRAMWFARGFDSALPSFDQEVSAMGAQSDTVPWADHVEEFRGLRQSTVAFFRNLPPEAWMRSGTASGNLFTVRALAYIAAGHLAHHSAVLREKYLVAA
ncbi:MAG: DinB family protein [Acidobacteriota bacterium]|nr:DinB family protein [Acidobacteriota bacterium]